MFELKNKKISFREKMVLGTQIMNILDGVDDWEILHHVVREVYIAQVYLNNFDKFVRKHDEDQTMDIMSTYDVIYELGFSDFMEKEIGREYSLTNEIIDSMLAKKAKENDIVNSLNELVKVWTEKTKDIDVEDLLKDFKDLDFDKLQNVKKVLNFNNGQNE